MSLKDNLHRRLTARQAILVVLAAATLAGLGYVAHGFIAAAVLEARVRTAMPKVYAEIREQRHVLVSAIEMYKTHFGSYPSDHVVSRQPLAVDAVNNPLYYELAGVLYNPTNEMFELSGLEAADAKFVKQFFQSDGFKNCGEKETEIKRLLTLGQLLPRQLHDDPDVFAVGFSPSFEPIVPEVFWQFNVSSWRYVSSSPTNNPGRFDLWIELKTKRQAVIIGNWAAVD